LFVIEESTRVKFIRLVPSYFTNGINFYCLSTVSAKIGWRDKINLASVYIKIAHYPRSLFCVYFAAWDWGWRNISQRKAALAASIYQLSEKFSSSFTPTNLARQLSKYAHKRDELHYCGFTFQPRLVTEERV
jgi:hypothetical protein